MKAMRILLLLACTLTWACKEKKVAGIQQNGFSDKIVIKLPGCFVLSNRLEYVLIGIKPAYNRSLVLKAFSSTNGVNWVENPEGQFYSNSEHAFELSGDKVRVSSFDDHHACLTLDVFGSPNTAVAGISGHDILTDTNLLQRIKIKTYTYHSIDTNRLTKFIEDQVRKVRR